MPFQWKIRWKMYIEEIKFLPNSTYLYVYVKLEIYFSTWKYSQSLIHTNSQPLHKYCPVEFVWGWVSFKSKWQIKLVPQIINTSELHFTLCLITYY